MKRMLSLCAAALCLTLALSPAALAAGDTAESQACYPTAVYQSEDGTELKKIYDLSPEDDPAGITARQLSEIFFQKSGVPPMDSHYFAMQKNRHPYHASNGRVHARRVPA